MTDSVAGIVLAAGAGSRLFPLTRVRPKALCPVGGVPLVDLARARLAPVAGSVAVNVHHGRDLLVPHLEGRVHLSVEEPEALGTAGALGRLRPWIDGRPCLVVNADTWTPGGVEALVDDWDGERVRVLVVGGGELGPRSLVAGCLVPWAWARDLAPTPSGLYEQVWRPAQALGRLESVPFLEPTVDCGTPAAYLAANLVASGGRSVVDPTATVAGEVVRSVVWPDAEVAPGEVLVQAIRYGSRATVLVR
jgi:CTP:molybdopterin cytidylyltransferase MocA